MCRRIKSSQNVQPQVDLPSTELPFFPFESLLNLFTDAEFTNTHGAVTGKKWPFTQGKNSPPQRYTLLGCGQVCRIWPLVGSRGILLHQGWFLSRFKCGARPCVWLLCDRFVMQLPAPAALCGTCLGLFAMRFFGAGRKPLRVAVVYFEMSSKGLTFQDTHLIFQPAVLLQQIAVGRVQCIQAQRGWWVLWMTFYTKPFSQTGHPGERN